MVRFVCLKYGFSFRNWSLFGQISLTLFILGNILDRLAELGWHPFKADSKMQPNCCVRFIFGGNHDRTLKMAFGDYAVNLDKKTDNSPPRSAMKSNNGQKTSMTGAPDDTDRRTSSASRSISPRGKHPVKCILRS